MELSSGEPSSRWLYASVVIKAGNYTKVSGAFNALNNLILNQLDFEAVCPVIFNSGEGGEKGIPGILRMPVLEKCLLRDI